MTRLALVWRMKTVTVPVWMPLSRTIRSHLFGDLVGPLAARAYRERSVPRGHCGWIATRSQPARNNKPPIGVIAPSQRILVRRQEIQRTRKDKNSRRPDPDDGGISFRRPECRHGMHQMVESTAVCQTEAV